MQTDRSKYLIVVAGGRGERMGGDMPKQFRQLCGKTILQLSIEKFLEAVPDIKVVVVLPEDGIENWKKYCAEANFFCPQTLASGGFTRFHSVRRGLEKVPDGAIVAVHDGVRPLVSVQLIQRLFDMAKTSPAVIPVVPCTDTLKVIEKRRLDGGKTVLEQVPGASVDRERIFAAQTPQVFHSEILREAYSQAFDTSFTDDSSVVEKIQAPIAYAMGDKCNIKITSPEDLLLAEALLRNQSISCR